MTAPDRGAAARAWPVFRLARLPRGRKDVPLVAALFFAVVCLATGVAARVLGLARADRIAAVFCGSKKTLASGVPMAKLMFGASPALGVILLPIMIYHPLQLVVCGFLAERWGREKSG